MFARLLGREELFVVDKFYREYAESGGQADLEEIRYRVRQASDSDSAIVVERDGVVIGGMSGHLMKMFSENKTIFFVVFFYIKKSFRKYIREFMESVIRFLKDRAQGIVIASPYSLDSEKRERLYGIMGFNPVETHFMRAI